jgi:hypothetical protein
LFNGKNNKILFKNQKHYAKGMQHRDVSFEHGIYQFLYVYANKNKIKGKERWRKPPGEKASHSHSLYLIWEDDCRVGE